MLRCLKLVEFVPKMGDCDIQALHDTDGGLIQDSVHIT